MKVKVIDNGRQYDTYEKMASEYTNGDLWFEYAYVVSNGSILELIEYTNHGYEKNTLLAICKDDSNRIIIIGNKGIEEIKGDETMEIKIGDICEVVNGWGMDFQQIGTKVRVVDIYEGSLIKVERTDKHIRGICYVSSIKPIEKTPLLSIGTRVKVVKDILSIEDLTGKIFVIEQSNEHFAVSKKLFENNREVIFTFNPFHIENGYVEILKDEPQWSDWKFDLDRMLHYRVKGNKIQAKFKKYRVQAVCMEEDTFDLEKGLDICHHKLAIKIGQDMLKELCK